jgi:hypothetical protein
VAHPHGYVQCIFVASRTGILCEASSGYHYNRDGTPRTFFLPKESIAALGRLGFSTDDTAGNFRYEALIASPPDVNAIADLILTALHDAYGARAGGELRFNAPLPGDQRRNASLSISSTGKVPYQRCLPRSARLHSSHAADH